MYIIKKDGTKEPFNVSKVVAAVNKSAERVLYTFTPDELECIGVHRAVLSFAAGRSAALRPVLGGPDDKAWEKYLKTLDRCGMSELLEVYQAAYDRYAEAK